MLIQANTLHIPLKDKSVHCVVTSPPYYGLRDYQVPGQLGLEPTLQEYIDNTVLWCREVWRVLRDDGTFWLNIGDSYNGSGPTGSLDSIQSTNEGSHKKQATREMTLKPKDLMMVPHRVAIALQEDGWYVRSDIVWHKPNPMPESVQDRPTKSHEYIFLLTKSRRYFYDADAIREESKDDRVGTVQPAWNDKVIDDVGKMNHNTRVGLMRERKYKSHRNKRSVWEYYEDEFLQFLEWKKQQEPERQDVWTITTKPYPGAHFATFPPEIPETCIKAGTSEKGVCPVCGAQWVREIDVSYTLMQKTNNPRNVSDDGKTGYSEMPRMNKHIETIGWKPTCDHNEEPVPALVLDPFVGSGTTVAEAKRLGRKGIGIDLSWDYLQLAKERTGQKALEEWIHGKEAEANLDGLPLFDT